MTVALLQRWTPGAQWFGRVGVGIEAETVIRLCILRTFAGRLLWVRFKEIDGSAEATLRKVCHEATITVSGKPLCAEPVLEICGPAALDAQFTPSVEAMPFAFSVEAGWGTTDRAAVIERSGTWLAYVGAEGRWIHRSHSSLDAALESVRARTRGEQGVRVLCDHPVDTVTRQFPSLRLVVRGPVIPRESRWLGSQERVEPDFAVAYAAALLALTRRTARRPNTLAIRHAFFAAVCWVTVAATQFSLEGQFATQTDAATTLSGLELEVAELASRAVQSGIRRPGLVPSLQAVAGTVPAGVRLTTARLLLSSSERIARGRLEGTALSSAEASNLVERLRNLEVFGLVRLDRLSSASAGNSESLSFEITMGAPLVDRDDALK